MECLVGAVTVQVHETVLSGGCEQSMRSQLRMLSLTERPAAIGHTDLIYKKRTLQTSGVSVSAKKKFHAKCFVFLSDLKRFERAEEEQPHTLIPRVHLVLGGYGLYWRSLGKWPLPDVHQVRRLNLEAAVGRLG